MNTVIVNQTLARNPLEQPKLPHLEIALKGLEARGLETRTARILERFGNEAICGVKAITVHITGIVSVYELGATQVLTGVEANKALEQLCFDFIAGDAKWITT